MKTALVLCLALVAVPLVAHHGRSAAYDQKRVAKAMGTVKEFVWRNPHCALFMDGKDESGATVAYSVEMGSPGTLVRAGLTKASFKPGDQVVIEMHPAFANPAAGEFFTNLHVELNGKELKLTSQREN